MPNIVRHPERQDVYLRVTDRIVADLERGVRPWTKPWNAEHAAGRITRPLRANGIPYRGINVILLWMTAMERGYASPLWLTYRQAQELGGQVRKGETGTLVVFASRITRTEQDEHGEDIERDIHFMKGYTVFNAGQANGLPAHFYASVPTTTDPLPRFDHAEAFFAATGADIRHGGNSAYYAIGSDHVQMPPFETFRDAESYCATLAHETTHWTRHPSRLDRDFGRQRWGDEGYAREELVAELGAAFLCTDLGLTLEPREDHAAYIASWLKVLRNDKRFVFIAAAHAQRAADFLHGLQPKAETAASEDEHRAAA